MNYILNKNLQPFGYVYKIINLVNEKVYIGQSKESSYPFTYLRCKSHLLKKGKTSNKKLKSAIDHYTINLFKIQILCECYCKEDLDWSEDFYIREWYDSQHYSRGYNIANGGISGGQNIEWRKGLSEEQKKDISRRTSKKLKDTFSDEKYKIFFSESTKNYRKNRSEEENKRIQNLINSKLRSENYKEMKKLNHLERMKNEEYKIKYCESRKIGANFNKKEAIEKAKLTFQNKSEEEKSTIKSKRKINHLEKMKNIEYRLKYIEHRRLNGKKNDLPENKLKKLKKNCPEKYNLLENIFYFLRDRLVFSEKDLKQFFNIEKSYGIIKLLKDKKIIKILIPKNNKGRKESLEVIEKNLLLSRDILKNYYL